LLIGLTGGNIEDGDQVDVDSFKGKHYLVSWQKNPRSTNENGHIETLKSLASANGAALSIGKSYWVKINSADAELMTEHQLQELCDKVTDDTILVQAADSKGHTVGAALPPSEFGFERRKPAEIPF
jgi:hypothetical protein